MERTTLSVTTPNLSRRLPTIFNAALFVLGFSLVFILGWSRSSPLPCCRPSRPTWVTSAGRRCIAH